MMMLLKCFRCIYNINPKLWAIIQGTGREITLAEVASISRNLFSIKSML